jgi:DNA polymerase-3 subunit alpha (Gram-positive type)
MQATGNGLIIGSGCEAGELFQAILKGESDKDLTEIARFYDYLEIQPLCNNEHLIKGYEVKDIDELKDINRRIVEIGESWKAGCGYRRCSLP